MPQIQSAHVATFDFGAPDRGTKATGGRVALSTAAPADGDTITLTDAEGTTRTFEFDPQSVNDGVASGNIEVAFDDTGTTANNLDAAVNALAAAINDDSPLLIDATADPSNDRVDMNQTEPLASGNTAVQSSFGTPANVTTTDFSGGEGEATERRTPLYPEPRAGGGTPSGQRRRIPKATPIEFRVADAGYGRHDITFQNADGVNDINVSIEVSPDGLKYFPTNASDHGEAVDGVTIQRKTNQTFTVIFRATQDKYVRLLTTGGARGVMNVRPEGSLQPITN